MSIADRIRIRRNQLGISQEVLASRCGWEGQSRISGYETGARVPPLKVIKILEKALEVPPGYLTLDDEDQDVRNIVQTSKNSAIHKDIANPREAVKIDRWKRLYSLEEAHRWDELADIIMKDTTRQLLPIPENLNSDCFHVQISNDSMQPTFEKGEFVVIDPHAKPKYGAYALVRIIDGDENIVSQYFEKDNEVTLSFPNTSYPKIKKKLEQVKVIGVIKKSFILKDYD